MKKFLLSLVLILAAGHAFAAFDGALVAKVASQGSWQSIQNNAYVRIIFDQEVYDTQGFYDPAYPYRFTIPAGITKVRLSGQFVLGNVNTAGERLGCIWKNQPLNPVTSANEDHAGFYLGAGCRTQPATPGDTTDMGVETAIVPVYEGDYFDFRIKQTDGGNLQLYSGDTSGTWFSIEAIEYGDNTPPDPDPEPDDPEFVINNSGTVIFSSSNATWPAANWFDTNDTTWGQSNVAMQAGVTYFGLNYPTAQEVRRFRLYQQSVSPYYPDAVYVQYADGACTSWTTTSDGAIPVSTADTTYNVAAQGTHKCWRLLSASTKAGVWSGRSIDFWVAP